LRNKLFYAAGVINAMVMRTSLPLSGEPFSLEYAFMLGVLGTLGVMVVVPEFANHNSQRIAQILIFSYSACFFCCRSAWAGTQLAISSYSRCTFFLICWLGLISTLLSHHAAWSLLELSVAVCCCVLARSIAYVRRKEQNRFDRVFLLFVLLLVSTKILQFFAALAAAYASTEPVVDTDWLLLGFSHKRSYGQLQTFTLPLLAIPLLCPRVAKSLRYSALLLLGLWWMIAVLGGTRGTWLGMAVAVALLAISGKSGRRWAGWQILGAILGTASFWVFIGYIPAQIGLEVLNFAGDRLEGGLTGREFLWSLAWHMIIAHPVFGYGPMGFADIPNFNATHPHQAILQWASEWGVVSVGLVALLASRGLRSLFHSVQTNEEPGCMRAAVRLCFFASLLAALTQSMFDGVLVVPNSQLWLAIVVGVLLPATDSIQGVAVGTAFKWVSKISTVLAVVLLICAVVRFCAEKDERDAVFVQQWGGYDQPRFWIQGITAFGDP
jgi:O-antigen ligase